MGFTISLKDVRKCSVCQAPSYRVIGEDESQKIGFGIPALEITDAITGKAKETDELFTVFIYSCIVCKHLDFYGMAEFDIPA